jgi:hypothetical protein
MMITWMEAMGNLPREPETRETLEPVTFDSSTAFDAAEALNILAHDYGLYAVKARLDDIPFRAGPNRETLEGIDETGREFYAQWREHADRTGPWEVPDWAEAILVAIVAGSSSDDS